MCVCVSVQTSNLSCFGQHVVDHQFSCVCVCVCVCVSVCESVCACVCQYRQATLVALANMWWITSFLVCVCVCTDNQLFG